VVCPEDNQRLLWQSDPLAYDRGEFVPNPGTNASDKRWPYSSSYRMIPAAFSPDKAQGNASTVSQSGAGHRYYNVPGTAKLGRRKLADVNFPSQKVLIYDDMMRHTGKGWQFYCYEDSKIPLLFFDGSVVDRVTNDSNPGVDPSMPDGGPSVVIYAPDAAPRDWEPRPRNGLGFETLVGHYQWTRGGLRGVDFGGSEVR
jgi:hypothetical protein